MTSIEIAVAIVGSFVGEVIENCSSIFADFVEGM